MDAISEAELTATNPYFGDDTPPVSYRTIVRTRKADWAKQHPMPNPHDNFEGWKNRMGARIARVCKDKGIKNTTIVNQIRDKVFQQIGDDFDSVWWVLRRILRQRKSTALPQPDETLSRVDCVAKLFRDAGLIDITHMSEFREYIASFSSDKVAIEWGKSFIRGNKDNDIETATRSMKGYHATLKAPKPATPEQLAALKDPAVDKGLAAKRADDGDDLVTRKHKLADKPNSDSLDAWFPRDKKQEDNVTDTPIEEQAAETRQAKNNWIADREKQRLFYANAGEIYQDHDVPQKERSAITHRAAGDVKSLYDYEGTGSDLLKKIKAICVEEYPIDEKSNEKADFSDETKSSPVRPESQNKPIAPNSTPSNGQPKEFLKLDEQAIRNKYTKKLQCGKEYLEVAGRVLLLRLEHKDWTIDTKLINADENGAVFKARILDENGKLIATGHACAVYAKANNFSGRVFEKAETAAIGRALAHAGYGTDDIDETDDSESPAHLADSPRAAA